MLIGISGKIGSGKDTVGKIIQYLLYMSEEVKGRYYPYDVFIDEFKKRDFEVLYIGSNYGQDRAWFENDIRLKDAIFLDTSGVVNKKVFAKIFSLLNIFYYLKL